jgi:uncharacterized protein (DUF2147 family)
MKKLLFPAAIILLCAAPAIAGDETGNWKRPNGDTVEVKVVSNALFCKITKGKKVGFEMCHGMKPTSANVWKGKGMKHPSMPGFMTFNGTVTVNQNKLEIKGCVAGDGVCDKEAWSKIN